MPSVAPRRSQTPRLEVPPACQTICSAMPMSAAGMISSLTHSGRPIVSALPPSLWACTTSQAAYASTRQIAAPTP